MAIIPLETITEKPVLGISACLIGEKVRYNGGHKRSKFCLNLLDEVISLIAVCPEVAIGLGVPRKPIHLTGTASHYDATEIKRPDIRCTNALTEYAHKTVAKLHDNSDHPISGYILMQKSPSCGMSHIKIYGTNGMPTGQFGTGIFAKTLMNTLPLLPVEEEGRLHDAVLRENFFTRVYAYYRWQQLTKNDFTYQIIERFHARYKYILMAHKPDSTAELGRYLATHSKQNPSLLATEYIKRFMQVLRQHTNRKSHTNVLLHLTGYMKKTLPSGAKENLLKSIEAYRTGLHPLVVPVSMIRDDLSQYGNEYINAQYYLNPYPDKLGLRNNI
ncbi:MAG: DUF523 and DUF1722 domain-containing protein [Endozoicomonadaceae bacterium]|nr:DUF523 and DUF1722 domain-containing protein [Endozoicomonadaceae bacterium]